MKIILDKGMSNKNLICSECRWFDDFCNQPQMGVYLHGKRKERLAEGKTWIVRKISCLFKEKKED